ncbi:MAG TPA: penicillin acylase family protein [Polyangiaceae bacterium]|jgi:penicillin amidase|nr:penicillin acylase family protein [Polyangiaceae bacterium]
MTIPGPERAIAFTRDDWGYPSVKARDLREGTFALGYLHARDRLVQVTLTGLAARGELMSVLGDVPIARLIDYGSRALGLGRDVKQQVAQCTPESQALLRAYADGFNAGARARGYPLLLRLLGVPQRPFSAERVLEVYRFVTYFGLTSMTLSTELVIAELAARGAPRRLFERLLGPNAQGIDLEALKQLRIPAALSFFAGGAGGSTQAGSNAFAVSAQRSSTGGALLSGEFHMEVGKFPPLLYAAELAFADESYLCGITIPGCPWFAAGRTEHVGWSYTFGHADNVDFIAEQVRAGEYLREGRYRPLKRREEVVAIKGKPSETWAFHESDRGTVLGDVDGEAHLPGIRITGIERAHRAFSAATRITACRTVDDLLEVQREIQSVSLEAILVDSRGDIASILTGTIDEKPDDYSGAYPQVGATLSAELPEAVPEGRRPIALRPAAGVLVSANQGGHGPHRKRWCPFPEAPYRFERINELLAQRKIHHPSTLLRIAYDTFDGSARRLLPIWAPLLPDHPLAHALVGWADSQADRALVSVFCKLYDELCFLVLEQDMPRGDARRMREWSAVALYQDQLDRVLALECPELLSATELEPLLRAAFDVALAEHAAHDVPVRMRFAHLVTRGRSPAFLGFDSPTIELPGTPVSPFQCRVSPISGERLVYAPAFHLLMDMKQRGAWYNLPGGASESRFGPGYGKGVAPWLAGTVHPLGSSTLPVMSLKDEHAPR